MMALSYLRHLKSKQVNLMNHLTTTIVTTTAGITGSAVDLSGYQEGIFFIKVNANTSGVVQVLLDSGVVHTGVTTTAWSAYATIDADMTTTANNACVAIEVLPDIGRARIPVITTTAANTTARFVVDAVLRV
jgi:hypothetical protein